MHRNTKVATCCYCGTRAALVLGKERHELACSNCGAPLNDLRSLKVEKRSKSAPSAVRTPASEKKPGKTKRPKKAKKVSRKKGFKHLLGEIIDEIDDIFD